MTSRLGQVKTESSSENLLLDFTCKREARGVIWHTIEEGEEKGKGFDKRKRKLQPKKPRVKYNFCPQLLLEPRETHSFMMAPKNAARRGRTAQIPMTQKTLRRRCSSQRTSVHSRLDSSPNSDGRIRIEVNYSRRCWSRRRGGRCHVDVAIAAGSVSTRRGRVQ